MERTTALVLLYPGENAFHSRQNLGKSKRQRSGAKRSYIPLSTKVTSSCHWNSACFPEVRRLSNGPLVPSVVASKPRDRRRVETYKLSPDDLGSPKAA